MFDTILCSREMPDGYISPDGYQSQDLDCKLDVYRITDDGRLLKTPSQEYSTEPSSEVETDFHGWLHFYDYPRNGVAHLYNAKFTDGRLVKIVVAENPRTKNAEP